MFFQKKSPGAARRFHAGRRFWPAAKVMGGNQLEYPEIAHLSFEERLSLHVDGEVTARSNRRLNAQKI